MVNDKIRCTLGMIIARSYKGFWQQSTCMSTIFISELMRLFQLHLLSAKAWVYGVKLWNSLSNNLRDCNSVINFKKNLKKYFTSIY